MASWSSPWLRNARTRAQPKTTPTAAPKQGAEHRDHQRLQHDHAADRAAAHADGAEQPELPGAFDHRQRQRVHDAERRDRGSPFACCGVPVPGDEAVTLPAAEPPPDLQHAGRSQPEAAPAGRGLNPAPAKLPPVPDPAWPSSGALLEGVLELLDSLLEVALALVVLAFGAQPLVASYAADLLLGVAGDFLDLVPDLVRGAHSGSSWTIRRSARCCRSRSASDSPPQTPEDSPAASAYAAHGGRTGQRRQTAFAAASRAARCGPRSLSEGKNRAGSAPRQAAASCQPQRSATGPGSRPGCVMASFPRGSANPRRERIPAATGQPAPANEAPRVSQPTGKGRHDASRPAARSGCRALGLAAGGRLPGCGPGPVLSRGQRARAAPGRPRGGGKGGLPALPGPAAVRGARAGRRRVLRGLGRAGRVRPGAVAASGPPSRPR